MYLESVCSSWKVIEVRICGALGDIDRLVLVLIMVRYRPSAGVDYTYRVHITVRRSQPISQRDGTTETSSTRTEGSM